MSKGHHLTSPFSEEVIRSLHAGDTVYFDGPLFGIRDLTLSQIMDEAVEVLRELCGLSAQPL